MVGNVGHDGTSFRVHLHVMPPARHELTELLAFRDALRADPALRDGYARSKQEFVEAAPDGDANLLYTIHKGGFVLQSLYRLGIRKGPADAPDRAPARLDDRDPRRRPARPDARRSPRASWATASPSSTPTRTARPASVADRVVVGAYDDVDAAHRLAAELRGRDLRAGARRAAPRSRRSTPATCRCGPGSVPLEADRRTGSPSGGSSRRTGSRSRRGARSVASTRPARPPPSSGLPVAAQGGRSAATTAGARSGSRTRTGVEAAVEPPGAIGRPLLLERELRLRGGAVGRRRARPSTAIASRSRSRATSTTTGSSSRPSCRPAIAAEVADGAARARRAPRHAGWAWSGLLTVELFLMPDGSLVVNELAPRVHNSGHWTIEGAVTSQFEQHLRAICGLPLGLGRDALAGRGDGQPARRRRATGRRDSPGLDEALADPDVAPPPLRQARRVRAPQDGPRDRARRDDRRRRCARARDGGARAGARWRRRWRRRRGGDRARRRRRRRQPLGLPGPREGDRRCSTSSSIPFELRVVSAHRSPDHLFRYAEDGGRPRDAGDHRGRRRRRAPAGHARREDARCR